ncbi:MAG: hypothetical protein Q8N58_02305 [bacterium]|nr:hypothetical protein [bacterium]
MNNKQKIALAISGAAVILFTAGFLLYPYLPVKALSIDILPDTINNAELIDFYEEAPGQGIVEGLTAYYQSENQDITVLFWKLENQATAENSQETFLGELRAEYDSMFDSVDWSVNHEFTVEEHKAYAATFRAYLGGEYHDGGIMFTAASEFFLVVQIVNYSDSGAPSFSELQAALAILINNVPGEAPSLSPSLFLPGGEEGTGECLYYDCPSGLCATENWCVELRSEQPQEIKDEKIAEDIYKDATNYKEEYIEAYEKIQGGIGQTVIKDAKLDVKLEIQGSTAGKLPKASQGDDIEVRLEIANNSDYQLGLIAGIFYPEDFDLEEKKYTVSFEWNGGLSSLIGSFETKLINSKFIIMPSGSKIIVYSKVVPKQTGYLDVQGLVFFATEKKYQDYDPGFLDEVPKSYQESEISETILVEEKPCNWWPICL